jgi:uncharacterized phiE125 gp8 family phage protein
MRHDRSRLKRVTAPGGNPLTLEQVRLHLKLDTEGSPETHADDDLVEALMEVAVNHIDGADGWLGRAIVEQTWDYRLDAFPDYIVVPLPPLLEVVSITYLDDEGETQTVDEADYRVVDGEFGVIVPAVNASWPSDVLDDVGSVTVRFKCGYEPEGSPVAEDGYGANVPAAIKQAMLLAIGHFYVNRDDTEKLPGPSQALLAPFRIYA